MNIALKIGGDIHCELCGKRIGGDATLENNGGFGELDEFADLFVELEPIDLDKLQTDQDEWAEISGYNEQKRPVGHWCPMCGNYVDDDKWCKDICVKCQAECDAMELDYQSERLADHDRANYEAERKFDVELTLLEIEAGL